MKMVIGFFCILQLFPLQQSAVYLVMDSQKKLPGLLRLLLLHVVVFLPCFSWFLVVFLGLRRVTVILQENVGNTESILNEWWQ